MTTTGADNNNGRRQQQMTTITIMTTRDGKNHMKGARDLCVPISASWAPGWKFFLCIFFQLTYSSTACRNECNNKNNNNNQPYFNYIDQNEYVRDDDDRGLRWDASWARYFSLLNFIIKIDDYYHDNRGLRHILCDSSKGKSIFDFFFSFFVSYWHVLKYLLCNSVQWGVWGDNPYHQAILYPQPWPLRKPPNYLTPVSLDLSDGSCLPLSWISTKLVPPNICTYICHSFYLFFFPF